jgi:hypothetical protein
MITYSDWLRALAEQIRVSKDETFYICHCLSFMDDADKGDLPDGFVRVGEALAAREMYDSLGYRPDYMKRLGFKIDEIQHGMGGSSNFGTWINQHEDYKDLPTRNLRRVEWLKDYAEESEGT